MLKKGQRNQIIKYFNTRLECLDRCNASFENNLLDDKQKILNQVNQGNVSSNDPDLQHDLFEIDYRIAQTFRYCMFVAVCTFLEECLRKVGKLLFDDFDSNVKHLRNMSQIRKYLSVLQSGVGIDLDPIQRYVDKIDEVICVRNSIIHDWGKLDHCKNAIKLRKIIQDNDWIGEPGDGYIFLEDHAYAEAVEPTKQIMEHVINNISVSEKTKG